MRILRAITTEGNLANGATERAARLAMEKKLIVQLAWTAGFWHGDTPPALHVLHLINSVEKVPDDLLLACLQQADVENPAFEDLALDCHTAEEFCRRYIQA